MRRALFVPAALMLVASACSSSSSPSASPPSPSSVATTDAVAPTTEAAAPVIQIKNFAYNQLTVAPGTTITVKNLDEAEHTVTSDKSGLFLADDVNQGKPVSFTAPTAPGTYTFHCEYHKNMHGTLIVS